MPEECHSFKFESFYRKEREDSRKVRKEALNRKDAKAQSSAGYIAHSEDTTGMPPMRSWGF
jgi:hypothetical protein